MTKPIRLQDLENSAACLQTAKKNIHPLFNPERKDNSSRPQKQSSQWNRMIYLMSKTREVFVQSSEPEAHVKNARQTKNTKQDKM